jgi:hypothetical protein
MITITSKGIKPYPSRGFFSLKEVSYIKTQPCPYTLPYKSKQVTKTSHKDIPTWLLWQYWNPYSLQVSSSYTIHAKKSINPKIWIRSSHTQIATILNTHNAPVKVELKLELRSLNTIIYLQNLITMLDLSSFSW